ncbi:hypothetical protein EZS27_033159 [termite gut metagenome]|uniref:Uncharacterized protein n=1 Tax=termite gut metagenome TaxID=433724 RepID=A0A5J4Q3Q3_9ZZZZ
MPGKLGFNAELTNGKNKFMKVQLELYKFKENDIHIIYCPSLDLSACGETDADVKKAFGEILTIHINYCIQENTFIKDLQKHGWLIQKEKQRGIKAPTTEMLLSKSKTLKDIIYNKEYEKVSEYVEMPELI